MSLSQTFSSTMSISSVPQERRELFPYMSVVPNGCREENTPRIPPTSPLLLAADRSSQSRAKKLVDSFPGSLGTLHVIDDIYTRTPDTTSYKKQVVNEKVYPTGQVDDMEEWIEENQPTIPMQDFKANHPLHKVGIDRPWQGAGISTMQEHEIAAHDVMKTRDADRLPTFNRRAEESSWTKRQMIHQLTETRITYLRKHAERTSAIRDLPRGPQLPREVDQWESLDALLHYDASVKGHRVAIRYPTDQSPSVIQLRLKVGSFLANLAIDRPDDFDEVNGTTFPKRARRDTFDWDRNEIPREARHDYLELVDKRATPEGGVATFRKQQSLEAARQNYFQNQLVRPDEEVDMLDFEEKDELEDLFDEDNIRVGVFDRNETDYYVGLKMQAKVRDMKKTRSRKERPVDVDAILLREYGYDEQTLNESVEQAWRNLVKSKKLLPPPVKKQPSPKKQPPAKKQPAPKRQSARPRRPPNQPQTQSQGGGVRPGVRQPGVDASSGRELPSPDWSPITLAGDDEMQDVPEELEQLDGPAEEQYELNADVTMETQPSPSPKFARFVEVMSLVVEWGLGGDCMRRMQEQRNRAISMVQRPTVHASMATERLLPTRGHEEGSLRGEPRT